MVYEDTVEAGTLALIKRLAADDKLKDFVLVGGTALALQLGHRSSVDIDLFSANLFNPYDVAKNVKSNYNTEKTYVLGNTVFSFIEGVKTDMLLHEYPWIRP